MRPDNAVLASISDDEYQRLLPYLVPVSLKAGEILFSSGSRPNSVYFLEKGVAALSVSTDSGFELELSIVGKESTVGEHAIFNYDFFIIESAMLTNGHGYMIDAKIFRAEFERACRLHDIVINNLEARIIEASQTSLCNQSHSIEKRLARWLLTLADRAVTEELDVTHDVIRKALGVTRSSTTLGATTLKKKGLIDYVHGRVAILDRYGLEKETCECYLVIEKALTIYRQAGGR